MGQTKLIVRLGNLFDSEAHTLINTVNCVGVMGKGIALEFKNRFPEMYKDYVERCNRKEVKLGQPYLFRQLLTPWILNFPTKDHWRSVSRLSDIIKGLEYLEKHYQEWGITSLAVPPLGCGQGQLEWRVVGPTLYRHLNRLNIPIDLYAPYGTPEIELDETFLNNPVNGESARSLSQEPSKINPAWVAFVEILARIDREQFHWPVGRTMFQKIAYFATAKSIPTGLRYGRSSYGPFAGELKSLMTRLVNHGLIQEKRLGRMFSIKPGPTYQDAIEVFQEQIKQWEEKIEKIADLFLRMDTNQAEVAATVHYAAQELMDRGKPKPSELDVLEAVMKWKQKRRPPLKEEDIAVTIRNLNILRWLDLTPSQNLPLPEKELVDV